MDQGFLHKDVGPRRVLVHRSTMPGHGGDRPARTRDYRPTHQGRPRRGSQTARWAGPRPRQPERRSRAPPRCTRQFGRPGGGQRGRCEARRGPAGDDCRCRRLGAEIPCRRRGRTKFGGRSKPRVVDAGIRQASPACGSGSRHRISADAGWNSTGVIAEQRTSGGAWRPRREARSSNLPLKVIEEIGASGIVSAKEPAVDHGTSRWHLAGRAGLGQLAEAPAARSEPLHGGHLRRRGFRGGGGGSCGNDDDDRALLHAWSGCFTEIKGANERRDARVGGGINNRVADHQSPRLFRFRVFRGSPWHGLWHQACGGRTTQSTSSGTWCWPLSSWLSSIPGVETVLPVFLIEQERREVNAQRVRDGLDASTDPPSGTGGGLPTVHAVGGLVIRFFRRDRCGPCRYIL